MINRLLLENMLMEDRVQFLQNKYKEAIDPILFNKLKATDPTNNKQFLQWIVDRYLKLTPLEQARFVKEDFSKVFEDLEFFNKYKLSIPQNWRDINKMLSFEDLFYVVKPIKEKKSAEIEQTKASKDVTKILDNSNYLIIIPNTEEASCLYGAGTRWCTASKNNNRFEYYNDEGPLFIVIHKNEKDSEGRENKYQFHFKSGQFMNVNDSPINFKEYIDKNPEVADALSKYYVDNNSNIETNDLIRTLVLLNRANLIPDDLFKEMKNKGSDYFKDLGFDVLYGLFNGGKIDYETVNRLSNDSTIKLEQDGNVYAIYPGGWGDDDIIKLFYKGNRKDFQYAAKQVLSGEAYEWFMDNREFESIENINVNLDEKTINEIKQQMLKDSPETDSMEYINLGGSDLLEYLSENSDKFDELNSEIVHGANDAYRIAMESAYWEAYTNAVISKLGPYKFEGDTLMFKTDFDKMLQLISTLSDYQENNFNYNNYTSWIHHALYENNEQISMRSDYYDYPSQEDTNSQIRERIGENR